MALGNENYVSPLSLLFFQRFQAESIEYYLPYVKPINFDVRTFSSLLKRSCLAHESANFLIKNFVFYFQVMFQKINSHTVPVRGGVELLII